MKIGSTYADLGRTDLAKQFYLNAISIDPFSKETVLYLILALTDSAGRLGSSLFMFYYKVFSIFI